MKSWPPWNSEKRLSLVWETTWPGVRSGVVWNLDQQRIWKGVKPGRGWNMGEGEIWEGVKPGRGWNMGKGEIWEGVECGQGWNNVYETWEGWNLGKNGQKMCNALQTMKSSLPGIVRLRHPWTTCVIKKMREPARRQDRAEEGTWAWHDAVRKTDCWACPTKRTRSSINPAAHLAPGETQWGCHAGAVGELGLQQPWTLALHVRAAPTSADTALRPLRGGWHDQGSCDKTGYKRALVVLGPQSSPHQRAFVCGACTGTTQVGVSLESLFDALFKWSRWLCLDSCLTWYLWHINVWWQYLHHQWRHHPGILPYLTCCVYLLCLFC